MNRALRVFGVCTLIAWTLLVTVWMLARTIVAVEKAQESWAVLTWGMASQRESSKVATTAARRSAAALAAFDAAASSSATPGTAATDTTATSTAAVLRTPQR
jgi:hypothetical protein